MKPTTLVQLNSQQEYNNHSQDDIQGQSNSQSLIRNLEPRV